MPITPFMGVRISWQTFARKSLLARLAASAASLASSAACSANLRSVTVRLSRDVDERADEPHRLPVGIFHGLAAAAEPADAAVEQHAAVLGMKHAARGDRGVQFAQGCLEVLGMNGREPLLARDREMPRFHPQEFEEDRGARELRGRKIELEDAEAACDLRVFQEIRGAARACLALLAARDGLAQACGQPLDLIAARRRHFAILQLRDHLAELIDAPHQARA